jgi:O-antigen/teichoic acid export membrane protein
MARGFRVPGTGLMLIGGLVSAVGAYLFQILGGRVLGAAGFAPISILWTLVFILGTVILVPVEQHATREAASGRRVLTPTGLLPSAVAVVLAGLVGAGFVVATLHRAFEGDQRFILAAIVLFVVYGVYSVGRGLLAGHRRFGLVGWALIGESVGRLALAGVFLALSPVAVGLGWAMALGALTVIGTRFWRHDHEARSGSMSGASKFLGVYVIGSAASQILLAGAPLAVLALGGGPELISITFVTFTLYRAPLTLIYLLQGRVLPYLVGLAEHGDRSTLDRLLWTIFRIGLVLCLAGALTGYLVGPDAVHLLLGAEFRPTAVVASLVAAGVVAAVITQLVGQVLVAEGRTMTLALVWSFGLAAALLLLAVARLEPVTTVALAFAAGELAAMLLMSRLAGTGISQGISGHDR